MLMLDDDFTLCGSKSWWVEDTNWGNDTRLDDWYHKIYNYTI